MSGVVLRPRAIAVLVALRQGPLTTQQISGRIGDDNRSVTHDLLCDMLTFTIDHRPGDQALWYLTHDGLGWLESNGLTADPSACEWTADVTRGIG